MKKLINLINDDVAWDVDFKNSKYKLILKNRKKNYIIGNFTDMPELTNYFTKIMDNFISGCNELEVTRNDCKDRVILWHFAAGQMRGGITKWRGLLR